MMLMTPCSVIVTPCAAQLESLEHRTLMSVVTAPITTQPAPLAGDAAITVNFQNAGAPTPAGCIADTGAVFSGQGTYTFGWNKANANGRDRNAANAVDQRFDTLNHMQLYGARKWEIELPNGIYQVKLSAGDASYINSDYSINVEGARIIDATPTDTQRWFTGEATVNVTDGRLSVTNGSGAVNNKINFIEIRPLGTQPAPNPTPAPQPPPNPTPAPAPNPAPAPAPDPAPTPTPPPQPNPPPAAGSMPWEDSGEPVANFSGPIVITRGGTYSGNWQSLDPNVPAVNIKTTEPVIIRDSTIRGRSDLIKASITQGANVTVINTRGYGMNPNVLGEAPGRFLRAEHFDNVVVTGCYMEGTAGINLYNFTGEIEQGDGVRIVRNGALNIDGRHSDGNGGWLDFNERERLSDGFSERGYDRVQFVQLNKVQSVPGIEIAWNQIINQPGKSRVEDNISVYRSSGTAASPIAIHDNYIHGAYTIKPWQTDTADQTWKYDWDYSGGGIILGDGGSSAYATAYNNQVVSTTNYGIAIYGGHDMTIRDNRVLSSGLLSDGRAIAAQNVGIYIWNPDGSGPAEFFNNSASGNQVGWINDKRDRNDWWIPDASSFTNNTAWDGKLTLTTEAMEQTLWQTKRAGAK